MPFANRITPQQDRSPTEFSVPVVDSLPAAGLDSRAPRSDPLGPYGGPLLVNLLAPRVLAERLATTERTLGDWRITGRGPKYIRVGRRVFYRPEAVDAWLLENEHLRTAEERS